ncbi:glycosyltransferase family 39 protein [Anaerolineales bacterium HSG24]|nr:glycosyltransferase family 39 protein [Anaerolineales bacterium HSG24]
MNLDTPSRQHALRLDLLLLLICLGLALLVRLPNLTSFLTADEARSWYGRSIIFLDALSRGDWANTAPSSEVAYLENLSLSPAPGVTTMWAGAIGLLIEYIRQGMPMPLTEFLQTIPFDPLDPSILIPLRLPGLLMATIAVGLTFWWSRPLIGSMGALLVASLIALDPFHLALSRVLGHDALVATFMWLSLLTFLRHQTQKISKTFRVLNFKHLILSGLFGGLAVLSKYPALFLGAFVGLMLLMRYLSRASFQPTADKMSALGYVIRDLLIWSCALLIPIIFIWPAMWVDPIMLPFDIISDALRASGNAHQKGSFFLNQPVPDPGPLYYLLVAIFRTSPVVIIGLLGLPLIFWQCNEAKKINASRGDAEVQRKGSPAQVVMAESGMQGLQSELCPPSNVMALLMYILLYTLLVTYGGKKQDRYLLPIFPALSMLATMGYLQMWELIAQTLKVSGISRGYLGLILLIQLGLIWPYHPYYFTYYNPMFGGPTVAAQVMQVGWGEGLNEAAEFLNGLPEIESKQAVSWYSTTFEPYFEGQTIYKINEAKLSRSPKPALAANYVILYINQIQRRLPSDGALAYFQQGEPLHRVSLNGLDYVWVYPAPRVSHIMQNQTRLVGQAELLGLEWLDEHGHGKRLEAIPSGTVPTLRLYWEWQGKIEADMLGLSVVDEAGHTVGWGSLISSTERSLVKQEGAIVVSDYAMPISPATQPGQYYLKAWLNRAETGERIGDFSFEGGDNLVIIAPPSTPTMPDDIEIQMPIKSDLVLLTLFGYNFNYDLWQPSETRPLELIWGKASPPIVPAGLEARLTLIPQQSDDHVISHSFDLPFIYPPDQWQSGDLFRQQVELTMPTYLPSGEYDLQIELGAENQIIGQIEVGGRSRSFIKPEIPSLLTAQLDDTIILLGYQLNSTSLSAETSLDLTLFWQALDTPAADYTVFVQLLNSQNQVMAQRDSQPQSGSAPTSSWATGEIVSDSYTLTVEPTTSETYRLIVGMYRPDTGERLPTNEEGNEGDVVTLMNGRMGE